MSVCKTAKTIRAFMDVADDQHRPHYVPDGYGHYDWSIERRTREFFPEPQDLKRARALWLRYSAFRAACARLAIVGQEWTPLERASFRLNVPDVAIMIVEESRGKYAQHSYHDSTDMRWKLSWSRGETFHWESADQRLKDAVEALLTASKGGYVWRDEFLFGRGEYVYWRSMYNIGD